jgi:hypothetical protein
MIRAARRAPGVLPMLPDKAVLYPRSFTSFLATNGIKAEFTKTADIELPSASIAITARNRRLLALDTDAIFLSLLWVDAVQATSHLSYFIQHYPPPYHEIILVTRPSMTNTLAYHL